MTRDERRVQYKCVILAGHLGNPEVDLGKIEGELENYAAWVGTVADALIEEDSQCK